MIWGGMPFYKHWMYGNSRMIGFLTDTYIKVSYNIQCISILKK